MGVTLSSQLGCQVGFALRRSLWPFPPVVPILLCDAQRYASRFGQTALVKP